MRASKYKMESSRPVASSPANSEFLSALDYRLLTLQRKPVIERFESFVKMESKHTSRTHVMSAPHPNMRYMSLSDPLIIPADEWAQTYSAGHHDKGTDRVPSTNKTNFDFNSQWTSKNRQETLGNPTYDSSSAFQRIQASQAHQDAWNAEPCSGYWSSAQYQWQQANMRSVGTLNGLSSPLTFSQSSGQPFAMTMPVQKTVPSQPYPAPKLPLLKAAPTSKVIPVKSESVAQKPFKPRFTAKVAPKDPSSGSGLPLLISEDERKDRKRCRNARAVSSLYTRPLLPHTVDYVDVTMRLMITVFSVSPPKTPLLGRQHRGTQSLRSMHHSTQVAMCSILERESLSHPQKREGKRLYIREDCS